MNASRLNDAGFSLAAGAVTYWVGEATHGTDYQNLDETPDAVATTIQSLATNAATWPVGSPAVPDPAA